MKRLGLNFMTELETIWWILAICTWIIVVVGVGYASNVTENTFRIVRVG